MLITTNIIPPSHGNAALKEGNPVTAFSIILINTFNIKVTAIPIPPETNPTISVSALNTLDISPFDAPIDRNIPISLVRSSTDI